ncbi:carbamoyltransferase [Mucilaginibacter sp. RCC_168]|uniref:carbamoyltransferase family protein n=1 Tax=Mucilaginibacter sp. RCC_168 TaxID=3239221 RepID=UPI00352442B6
MRNIIGISALYHDSACCILKDGKLYAAAQEERFTRIKHDPSIPYNAFMYCLQQADLNITDIDMIAFYENPDKKRQRQLLNLEGGSGNILPITLYNSEDIRKILRDDLGYEGPVTFIDHHLSHAASAFYFSGFGQSAILTVDGVGEWATTTYAYGDENGITPLQEIIFPHSLGLLYSTITHYLGFEVNEGEYKVMGLAPYGNPTFLKQIKQVIINEPDWGFHLNMDYFDFRQKDRMFTDALVDLLQLPPRSRKDHLHQGHKDLAKSLQLVLEEILLDKINYLSTKTQSENLCLAGGVALNCVANGLIAREGPFKNVFIQPAANDSGGAIGAAAEAYFAHHGKKPSSEQLKDVYLGGEYSNQTIKMVLDSTKLIYQDFTSDRLKMLQSVAERLAGGAVIGWFQGRMEFGPRALGSRSILADPRDPGMRDKVNALIKKREGFRPFAPVVLEENVFEHFDIRHLSPFMLETCNVISPLNLPSITHVDNSARVQTTSDSSNPMLAILLKEFDEITGCPILLNTSFNIKNEPIVCTPYDAIKCFIMTKLDYLVIGDFVVNRDDNSIELLEFLIEQSYEVADAIDYNIYTFL